MDLGAVTTLDISMVDRLPAPPRMSLRRSLPLLICGLLVLVIATLSWGAYRSVRETVVEAANERLSGVSDQIGGLLESSGRQMRPIMDTASRQPELLAYLRSPGPRTEAAALAWLRTPRPNSQQLTGAEILNANRRRILETTFRGPGTGGILESDEWPGDSAVVGRFRIVRDSLVYPVAVAVRDGGQTLGYLVHWRGLTNNAQTQRQFSRLIGADAGLYIGNDRGDVWTDLEKLASGPPVAVQGFTGLVEYSRTDGPRMAYVRPLKGLPWIVLLDFSSASVLSTARAFLRHLAVVGLAILLLGTIAAWALSRGIVQPLEELTARAEALAAGGDTGAVTVTRHAELARLAESFTTMVDRVNEAQRTLEWRVVERTRELKERNEELEAFAYSISHDLRAPLRAMQGFSQILLEDYGDRLDEVGRSHASRIIAGAVRMDQLIRDLLAYSRVSREHLDAGPLDLNRVVREALDQLTAQITESGATVSVQEPLPAVVGHGPVLSQVLANLVGNGVKFVPPGRVPALKLRAEPASGFVRLWVEDNGIGIRPEHRDRIFRVFERLHATDEYQGTGIGLAIVRKGVERMGGRVGVESTFGEGSQFWIELPAVRPAA